MHFSLIWTRVEFKHKIDWNIVPLVLIIGLIPSLGNTFYYITAVRGWLECDVSILGRLVLLVFFGGGTVFRRFFFCCTVIDRLRFVAILNRWCVTPWLALMKPRDRTLIPQCRSINQDFFLVGAWDWSLRAGASPSPRVEFHSASSY